MILTRRRALMCAGGATLLASSATAQQFPSRPIRLVLGYGAGGGTDNLARLYARHLQEAFGVPVVVDNRPGASEILAVTAVRSARPDGYTVWMATGGALSLGPAVRTDLPYEPLQDFTHIALLAEADAVLVVRPNIPVRSLGELISHAKANPGKLNYGSGGVGSGNHLQTEYLMSATGISMTHIPYRSDAELMQAILAGNVDVGMVIAQFVVSYISDNALRPLAVTGSQRMSPLPDVPTIAEVGGPELSGMGSYTFFGVLGPTGMPPALVQSLNDAINKVAVVPEVDRTMRERLLYRPVVASPSDFRRYLERELMKWRELGQKVRIGIQ